ncbi:hypothetical protein [Lacticaseibacillus hegangensis]|uniref:Uncharacterized protein n=1 Tax=Lacticaseibacillus hegangensis TaxID=2486010 RepID=A0ABW4CXB8_9LACO|nr:hypothetical protein [Lacticaseibacillus hegangensis]
MGGRGASSGISAKGVQYGNEFSTILAVDNIKFVKSTLSRNARIPIETMSAFENRVYVTVAANEKLKSIVFYAKDGGIRRQIDLDHKHMGQIPHVHEGDVTSHHKKFQIKLTRSDQMYINKVRRIWKEYRDE